MELKRPLGVYLADVKNAINESIRKSGLSRPQIADKMNELIVGDEDGIITTAQIDSWTKKDEKRTAFLKYLPVFCSVTNDPGPLAAYVSAVCLRLVSGSQINLLDLGESEMERIKAMRKRRVAVMRLGLNDECPEREER